MSVRVGVNGFGRIGRCVLREVVNRKDIEIVGINDIADLNNLAYLFKYDSVHRKFQGDIKVAGNSLVINGKKFPFTQEKEPNKLPWKSLGADIVFESTGIFTTRDKAAMHLEAGAKKVILSAPFKGEDGDFTMVYGVNHDQYDPEKHHVISNGSCTTNCFSPVVKVLHETFGIESGLMTTAHAYTSSQKVLDLPAKDWRRGRAASLSIIPTTTGAAIATTKVFPELKGKLDAIALRAPVPDGAIVDFVCKVKKEASVESVNAAFKKYAGGELKGVLEYAEDPIVSMDILGNPHSSIFDPGFTKVIEGTLIKVLSWYDNEWGFSMRMIDVAIMMGKSL